MNGVTTTIERRIRPRIYKPVMRWLFVAWAVMTMIEIARKALG